MNTRTAAVAVATAVILTGCTAPPGSAGAPAGPGGAPAGQAGHAATLGAPTELTTGLRAPWTR